MPQEDLEDLNVMNLTETKSQRAPTSETTPDPLLPQPLRRKDLTPVLVVAMGALLAVAIIYRLATPTDAA